MTNKQIEIAEKLESLVHKRFNKKTLEQELSKIFNENITIVLSGQDDKTAPDWNYIFCSDNEEYGGDFDIYVLKQRHKDDSGNTIYVTEVFHESMSIPISATNIHTGEKLVFKSYREAAKYFNITDAGIAYNIKTNTINRKGYKFEKI